MNHIKNRQLHALILGCVLLVAACSKEKDEAAILAENQKLSAADLAIKQQEAEKHSAEYFETDNQERVVKENNIIDDLNADNQNNKK